MTRGLRGLRLRMGYGGAVKLFKNYSVCLRRRETNVYVGAELSHRTGSAEPTQEDFFAGTFRTRCTSLGVTASIGLAVGL